MAYRGVVTSTSTKPQGGTRRPRVDRRQAIVAAAIELASEKPFDEVNASEIARRAGVSHGLLFYYFSDKWAVTAEALGQLLGELREFQAPHLGEDSVIDQLHGFTRRHIQFLQDRQAPYLALVRGGALARPEVRPLIDAARQEGTAVVAAILGLPETLSPMDDLALSGWVALLDVCTERLLTSPDLDADVVSAWLVDRLLDSLGRRDVEE